MKLSILYIATIIFLFFIFVWTYMRNVLGIIWFFLGGYAALLIPLLLAERYNIVGFVSILAAISSATILMMVWIYGLSGFANE